ncbi:hypothetical protein [Winogradskyella haliclonae]|uniref:Uncharacterized protein n=1 Tax=Winogradskyella haliclonae TaxID=2048558 RepID=A0ABQ2C2L3_9FLAO|nr:hypothetical protein [Winogradskyella haliclonae]GGI58475.1 hypothetical protein GCM10011444_27840 [Winogradskyella haliclonae]
MENIYEISEKFKQLGQTMNDFLIKNRNNFSEKDFNDLGDLTTQCFQLSDRIITDHADEGIAKTCFEHIVKEIRRILDGR